MGDGGWRKSSPFGVAQSGRALLLNRAACVSCFENGKARWEPRQHRSITLQALHRLSFRRQPLWDFLNNKCLNHRQSALPNPTRQFREQSTPKTPCRPLISSKKANARVSNSAQQIRRQAVDGDGGIARPWPEGPGPPEATTATATITMSSCGSAAKHGSVSKSSTPDLRCDADQELQSPQRRTPPVLGAADPHHGLDSENLSSLVDLSRVCEGDARQTKQGTTDRDN